MIVISDTTPMLDKLIKNEIRISKKLYQDILELVNE